MECESIEKLYLHGVYKCCFLVCWFLRDDQHLYLCLQYGDEVGVKGL